MRTDYTGFSALYDLLMDDVAYDRWAARVDTLLKAALPGQSHVSVADCACGTGAITIRLARMGYKLTGIDLSEDMLRIAYDKSLRAGLHIPFVHMDMTDFRVMKTVQAVNCSCDGVNYLTSMDKVKRFFQAANRALVPGGILTFDVSTRYKLSETIGCNTFGEDRKECTYLWQNVYDPETKLLEMRLNFFTPNSDGTYRRFDEVHIQRAHSDKELRGGLESCGFELLHAFEGFSDLPPSDTSERVLYVARKI